MAGFSEQDTIVLTLAGLSGVYVLASLFSETRKLHHIPTLGHDNFVLSYWSALRMLWDPIGYLRSEWAKIPPGTKFVKAPTLYQWLVLPASPEYYKGIASAQEEVISHVQFAEFFLQTEYTMFWDDIKDGLQVAPIRSTFTRSLGEFVPLVHEELVLAFERSFPSVGDEWKSFVWTPEILKIIAAISNRVLVGAPLCRDEEFIDANVNYAVEVVMESLGLSLLPKFLRPIAHRLFSPVPKRLERMKQWLQPLVDKHRENKRNGEPDETSTLLNWLVDVEDEHGKPKDDAIKRMMSVNFGSIHTTVLSFTHALYSLLSRPEYIEPLRAEVDQCVQEHGWTKDAVDKMVLVDGFIKESLRFDLPTGIMSGGRIVAQDTSLYGVPIPKDTMMYSCLIDAHFHPSAYGDTAHEFDPYRFIKIEEDTGRKLSIVSTSVNAMTFGHGRFACPGRYFAAQEKKLILAHLLHEYDVKLDSVDGKRPKNIELGVNIIPNREARVLLRKRATGASTRK